MTLSSLPAEPPGPAISQAVPETESSEDLTWPLTAATVEFTATKSVSFATGMLRSTRKSVAAPVCALTALSVALGVIL